MDKVMDESYDGSDVSLSPTQILERLQMLRQLQLMQRGKLNKQHLQYRETSESSSSMTEIVSRFSNSTSYNTFQSLLQSSNDISNGVRALDNIHNKVQDRDLIEGVSVLNLSQESQFILSSPLSHKSQTSSKGRETLKEVQADTTNTSGNTLIKSSIKSDNHNGATQKEIFLDDIPIMSPKKDFEQLLLEKLTKESCVIENNNPIKRNKQKDKKQFLKKGEGTARFGIKKNTVIIQNTKSLPWKKRSILKSSSESPLKVSIRNLKNKEDSKNNKEKKIQAKLEPQSLLSEFKLPNLLIRNLNSGIIQTSKEEMQQQIGNSKKIIGDIPKNTLEVNDRLISTSKSESLKAAEKPDLSRSQYSLVDNKGKTWAAILTNEQNDFLRKLKQSDYYKNFVSPTKSVISDISCDDTICKLRQEREIAEQNMFDLIENKVNRESFNLNNSFFNRFLKNNTLECSGESTPIVMQKCLSQNPDLMHIFPNKSKKRNEKSYSDSETTCSNNSDCCSDQCSSVSCCACETVERTMSPDYNHKNFKKKKVTEKKHKLENINHKEVDNDKEQEVNMTEDVMKANIVEMNTKLIAASEQLKAKICDLEDEINTFRKQNENLTKLREEIDQERQKFYDEKALSEQKFNEEKVLAEYYLAEEKEKLSKQKQMYDRYVREIRGRLSKKEKDEIINLKKEINDLKEEIRVKDVKSTSLIAKLRNQIKIIEKEKKDLQDEIEKLKKENKHIRHNNEVTRRLTNIKYLEEINKKLNNMCNKDGSPAVSEDCDIKYKAYEIEKQSRNRKTGQSVKAPIRPLSKAKSVPNLNVTSRYAKYFSQRDTASHTEQNTPNFERFNMENSGLTGNEDDVSNISLEDDISSDDENSLEKIYVERFKDHSPNQHLVDKQPPNENIKTFFIQNSKSSSSRNSKSPRSTKSPNLNSNETIINRPKSSLSTISNKSYPNTHSDSYNINLSTHSSPNNSYNRSQSPHTAFNHSSSHSATVILNNHGRDKLLMVSPEPAVSKTNIVKTNLNPTESIKFDGSRELRFPNGNVKYISADGKYSKFLYYNGDIKENFYSDGKIKYFYAETKTYHTTHADGLEVLEFPDGQVEKRYKDGSSEIRLPNGSVRYFDPKNKHVREEWRFPDGVTLTVAANGERRIVFSNGQIEVHSQDHKRREFPDGTVKLVYNDGTSETRYASGRVRIKDKHGNLIMDSAPG